MSPTTTSRGHERASSAYVPPLQRTEGQPPPIAANGGLSYMSFDRDGDAGTAKALEDALAEIAEGEGQRVTDMIDKAPPGPIKTKWGLGFRELRRVRGLHPQSNSIKAPEGGVALPLPYTVYERPTYSIVPSNAVWRDPARADDAAILRKNEQDNRRRDLYFPQVLRDARRIGEYYPGLSPNSPECMDKLGVSLAHLESKCTNIYDSAEVERVLLPGDREAAARVLPGRDRRAGLQPRRLRQGLRGRPHGRPGRQEPGRERQLRQAGAQRPERQQRPRALPRAADQEPAQFRAQQHYTEEEADAKMSRRFMSINLAKPMETVEQYPVRALRLALLRRPALHHQLPDLRRPRRRDHPLHLPSEPRVVLVPAAEAQRGLDAEVL